VDNQMIFNIAYGLISALGGWVLNNLKSSIDDLRKSDADLEQKLHEVDKLVAGQYVRRDELDKSLTIIFNKLDKIVDLLASKADK
jgi:phosphate uptake regulator